MDSIPEDGMSTGLHMRTCAHIREFVHILKGKKQQQQQMVVWGPSHFVLGYVLERNTRNED